MLRRAAVAVAVLFGVASCACLHDEGASPPPAPPPLPKRDEPRARVDIVFENELGAEFTLRRATVEIEQTRIGTWTVPDAERAEDIRALPLGSALVYAGTHPLKLDLVFRGALALHSTYEFAASNERATLVKCRAVARPSTAIDCMWTRE